MEILFALNIIKARIKSKKNISLYLIHHTQTLVNIKLHMKKRFASLIATVITIPFILNAQFSDATDIDDLALIYIGSQNRPDWTKEKFKPYIMHTYPDGTQSWMFDGLLFLDYMMFDDNGRMVGLGEDNVDPSRRVHWERLIDVQFGQDNCTGLTALDELIGELIPSLGEPGHKHKVVFSVPVPHTPSQIWGMIDGESINISTNDGKLKTMKWYADEFLKRWDEAGFKNIELDGIYWTKESFFEDLWNTVIPQANEYFHSLGLKVYWIPYLNASGTDNWKKWGMDIAYIQPGYFFRTDKDYDRLVEAVENAWHKDMALEMEFEGINYGYNTITKQSYTFIPENSGLHAHHPEFYKRFVDYIDYFEKEQVFQYMPIAYYNGRQAVFDFCNSKDPLDREIIDRLALILNKRHIETGWDTAPRTSGIDDAEIADFEIAYAVENGIYIADRAGTDVEIYSIDGKMIFNSSTKGCQTERLRYGITVPCRQGIYIVRTGSRSIKVAVN